MILKIWLNKYSILNLFIPLAKKENKKKRSR